METLDPILSRLSYEMTCFDLFADLMYLQLLKENRDYFNIITMLNMDIENSEDDFEMILIGSICDIDEESFIIKKVIEIVNVLLTTPDSILRPYQQRYVTENGENRVSLANFHSKFEGLSRAYFRFELDEVLQLIDLLQLPPDLTFNGYRTSSIEAISVSLHRLATKCRFIDMSLIYDRRPQFLSQIYAGTMVFLFRKFGGLVRSFEHPWTTERSRLNEYAASIQDKGCPLRDTVAFVDGSHIPVARPTRGQRSWYCGHHKCHCFKTLMLQYPNGLMTSFGPFDGTTHDSTAAQSIQLDELVTRNYTFADRAFTIFGDSGYAVTSTLITPFRRGAGQSGDEAEWNREMSAFRISVEWGIGQVKTLWKAVSNKDSMKALLSPVSIYWFNSVLLTNIHTCMNGSQISEYFNCEPPTAEEYLRM